MTEAELVRQAIWEAAQKLIHPNKSAYVAPEASVFKRINLITKQTIEFLKLYNEYEKSLLETAKLMKHSGDQEVDFIIKANAIESLQSKSTEAVSISYRQTDVRHNVLTKLWNENLLLAAGMLMKAASLGVDHDPKDMSIVDEAKRRGPLLVVATNRVTMGIDPNTSGGGPIDGAMVLVPAKPPVVRPIVTDPEEAVDNEQTAYFKREIGNLLWTKEVFLAAGRITAARSLALTPSWEDIEKTSRADHIGRLSVIKLRKDVEKLKTDDEEIVDPANHLKATIIEVENSLKVKRPIDQAILYAVQEKVSQYVWTSHPELVQARANLEKHGNYYTAHGDVRLVQLAHNIEMRLLDAISALLKEKEQKRIDETQSSFLSWLWRSSTTTDKPQPVSDELDTDILKNEIENESRTVRWLLKDKETHPITMWLFKKQHTLHLKPDDVTNELIDDSVKRAIETSGKQKADRLEHEEKTKARETSWW